MTRGPVRSRYTNRHRGNSTTIGNVGSIRRRVTHPLGLVSLDRKGQGRATLGLWVARPQGLVSATQELRDGGTRLVVYRTWGSYARVVAFPLLVSLSPDFLYQDCLIAIPSFSERIWLLPVAFLHSEGNRGRV